MMTNMEICRSILFRIRKGSARVLAFLLVLSMLSVSVKIEPLAAEPSAAAATIRLARTEGNVQVTDSAAKAMLPVSNMRLSSGTHSITSEASYAWLSLDDKKALKEDAVSEVELRQSADGKQLEVMLDSGQLFFNVTAPLQEDETLNIRTSTMVMGVRGTCGWVQVVNGRTTRVWLLEGVVTCFVTNPIFGQTKWITLHGGEYADFLVYDPTQPGDKTDIIIRRFGREDIPGFVLEELVGDDETIWKIWEDSGIDLRDLTREEAEERRKRDESEMAEKKKKIKELESLQENNISKDPVWERQITDDDDDSGPSNNRDEKPGRIRTLTMKVTAQEVQDLLNDDGVDQVILQPGSGDNTFDIDIPFTVPEGKTLTTRAGVPVDVNPGSSMTVNGTADYGDTMTNNGTTDVNSGNTLKVAGLITNNDTFRNNAPGRTLAASGLRNNAGATFRNAGTFEGSVTGDGAVSLTGGTFGGSLEAGSGTSVISGGTVSGGLKVSAGTVTISGGTFNGGISVTGGTVSITGGRIGGNVNASGSGSITMSGGTVAGSAGSTGRGSFRQTGGTISGDVSVNTDENGFDYDNGTITGSVVVDKGNFTVSGKFHVDVKVRSGSLIVAGSGSLDGNITGEGGSLVVKGGTVAGNITGNFASVNVSGGTINGNIEDPFNASAFTMSGGMLNGRIDSNTIKRFTLSGGKINGNVRLDRAETVTISGGEVTVDTGTAVTVNNIDLGKVKLTGGVLTGENYALIFNTATGTLSYDGGTTLRSLFASTIIDPVVKGWAQLPKSEYFELAKAYDVNVTEAAAGALDNLSTDFYIHDMLLDQLPGGGEARIEFVNTGAYQKEIVVRVMSVRGTAVTEETLRIEGNNGSGSVYFTMPDEAVTAEVSNTELTYSITTAGTAAGVAVSTVKGGAPVTGLPAGDVFGLRFENTTNHTRSVQYDAVTDGGVSLANGTVNLPPGGTHTDDIMLNDDNVTVNITDLSPALHDIGIRPAVAGSLDDFTYLITANGYEVTEGAEGETIVISFTNTSTEDRFLKYQVTRPVSVVVKEGALSFGPGGTASVSFTMPDQDVTALMNKAEQHTITLPAIVEGIDLVVVADGVETDKALAGQSVCVQIKNTSSYDFKFKYVAKTSDSVLLSEGTILCPASSNVKTPEFIMPDQEVVFEEFHRLSMIDFQEAAETPGVFTDITVEAVRTGTGEIITEADPEEPVTLRFTNTGTAERRLQYEIKTENKILIDDGFNTPAAALTVPAGGTAAVDIVKMPFESIQVLIYDLDEAVVLHTPLTDTELTDALTNYGADTVLLNLGMEITENQVTVSHDISIPAGKKLLITEEDPVELEIVGGVQMDIFGELENNSTVINRGTIAVNSGGVFNNIWLWNEATVTVKGRFNNYDTVINESGAMFHNLPEGTVDNRGTFDNDVYATVINEGTVINNSINTFINRGIVINGSTGVIANGPDQPGRFLNLTDGDTAGVILNAGEITSETDSIFVNEGVMVADPDASSPELDAGSNPVIESELGGMCGENVYWYVTKLITDDEYDEDEDITLPEGLAMTDELASAGEVSGEEDLYALYIAGSGEMDDFEADGGISTAPWNEGGYTIVSARIESGVSYIGAYTFYGMENLAKLAFAGGEEAWDDLRIGEGNEMLEWVEILCEGNGMILNEGRMGYAAMNAEIIREEILPEGEAQVEEADGDSAEEGPTGEAEDDEGEEVVEIVEAGDTGDGETAGVDKDADGTDAGRDENASGEDGKDKSAGRGRDTVSADDPGAGSDPDDAGAESSVSAGTGKEEDGDEDPGEGEISAGDPDAGSAETGDLPGGGESVSAGDDGKDAGPVSESLNDAALPQGSSRNDEESADGAEKDD